jgi:hypothetical protein
MALVDAGKRDRLARSAATAERIRHLVEDQAIEVWFDDYEHTIVNHLVAAVGDDEMRTAVADLKAVRAFRGHMKSLLLTGAFNAKKLATLES